MTKIEKTEVGMNLKRIFGTCHAKKHGAHQKATVWELARIRRIQQSLYSQKATHLTSTWDPCQVVTPQRRFKAQCCDLHENLKKLDAGQPRVTNFQQQKTTKWIVVFSDRSKRKKKWWRFRPGVS